MFFVKLYRIASSLSFMLKFWSQFENTKFQMTNTDMKNWIKNDQMNSNCSLYSHIEKILVINFKLNYINRLLNVKNEEKNDKLLVWMSFVIVACFVILIRLLLITKSIVYITNITIIYQLTSHWENCCIFHFEKTFKKRVTTKRDFQCYVDSLASTKLFKYSQHDHDIISSTFRLMNTDMTLTQFDKCILMMSQHMSSAKKHERVAYCAWHSNNLLNSSDLSAVV